MRVLVVSAEAIERLRATSALHLSVPDVEVLEAATAADAHQLVASEPVDVLVIDGDLAPEGGFSVLYEIRQAGVLKGEPTPPALVLLPRAEDRWLAAWAGANATLPKPVDPFALAQAVVAIAGEAPAPAAAGDEAAAEVAAAIGDT